MKKDKLLDIHNYTIALSPKLKNINNKNSKEEIISEEYGILKLMIQEDVHKYTKL